jgi:hypothetical protein
VQENDNQKNPKWKLVFTSRSSVSLDPSNPGELTQDFDSLTEAISVACDMLKGTRQTVIRIEQPSGAPLDQETIKHLCAGKPRSG